MPQIEALVLTDRDATPDDHTFNPRGIDSGVATYVESVTGVPIADRRITVSVTKPSSNGRVKVNVKVTLPVVQNVEVVGVTKPTIVRTNYADLTFNYDTTSSTRERDDLVAFVEGLLAWTDNPLSATIVDLEGLY
jgi:hypothetical protein